MLKRVLTYALVVSTMVWSVGLLATPLAVGAASSGDLIKLQCATGSGVNDPCRAVYYLGADGKRYVFPNQPTYNTWYPDFSGVQIVSSTEMSSYPIGGNVTYRPGVKLVKINTDPKVYAVSQDGTLHWVTTADIAAALYGANWATTSTHDVSDAFFVNYTVGSDIDAAGDFDPAGETANATTINEDKNLAGGGVPSGTSLTVSLASDTPASGLAICTAIRVPFTKINVMAASDGDIVIDQLIVGRGGVAADSNFGSLALIDAATNLQVGLDQNINSSHQAIFNKDITVPAGTSKSFILAGNMNPSTATNCTTAAGNVPALSLAGVTLKGGAAVIGSLPITGNYQTINGVTIGQVTVTRGSYSNATSTSLKVGEQQYIFSSLKLTADSTEDQYVEQIKFYNLGTASLSDDLAGYKLFEDNITEIAATFTVDGKYVTANFNTSVKIEKGKNKQFVLKANVESGSSRTIKFAIYRTTDIVSRGGQFGQARVPAYSGTGTGGTGEVITDQGHFTISTGTLRVDSNFTAVSDQNVAYGDEIVLGAWNFVVQGEAVEVTQLVLGNSSTTADSDTFDNVKLVDGSGTLVMGPSSSFTNGSVTFTETFEFPIGTNVVKVVADLESTGGFAANDTFYFQINPGSMLATGQNTGESITPTPGANVKAATQTFKGSKLVITADSIPTDGNVVIGAQDFLFASWNFDTSGSGEDIRITSIKIGNQAATTTVNPDNLTLYDMSRPAASACATDYPSASFDAYGCAIKVENGSTGTSTFNLTNPMVVPKETQRKIQLRGDVRTNAAGYVEEYVIRDDGTVVPITATGVNTGDTVTPSGSGYNATDGADITIVGAGTLTINTAASTPDSLVAVNETKELNRVRLTSTNEDLDVSELAVCISDGAASNGSELGDSDEVTEFKVYKSTDMANPIITGNIGSSNDCRTFTLAQGTITVPRDDSSGVVLVIKGTMSDIGTGKPGTVAADFKVGIGGTDGVKATGKSSSTTATETYTASTGSTFKLHKGYPTVAYNTLPATDGLTAGSIVSDFTISNPTANEIAVYRLSFWTATSGAGDLDLASAHLKIQSTGKTVSSVSTGTLFVGVGISNRTFTFTLLDPDEVTQTKRAYRIGAGESVRFQLVADSVNGVDGTNNESLSVYLSGDNATTAAAAKVGSTNRADAYGTLNQGNFVWSDLNANAAYDAVGSGNATNSAQWYNGYLVDGLASASTTAQVISE